MSELSKKSCTPCKGGIPALSFNEAKEYLLSSAPDWELDDGAHKIRRTFRFGNYDETINFVKKVMELVETEGHHPVITFGWGFCTIELQTKKIKGLHENDFIMAAKINAVE